MLAGTRSLDIPFSGGLDEASPSTQVQLADAIEMSNFRLSKDGKRVRKRLGLNEDATNSTFGTKAMYGYSTYTDSDSAFCQLAVGADKIWRKVAAAAWGAIHTFSSEIAHPVRPVSVQGKQFVINETDSRMIHTDKTDYQIGITAPTTLPTLTGSYVETPGLDDDMDYADQAAMDAVWTDGDSGSESDLETGDPNSTEGPDGDSKYMRFYDASPGTGRYARRSLTESDIGATYTIDMDSYFQDVGYIPWTEHFEIIIYNGTTKLQMAFTEMSVHFYDGTAWQKIYAGNTLDKWINWQIAVDTSVPGVSTLELYKDSVLQGSAWTWDNQSVLTPGVVQLTLYENTSGYSGDVYIDHFTIQGIGEESAASNLNGSYRYAITYARSGNYGCESNPIYSLVGTATLVGAGLDDLTAGGTYEGDVDRTIWVRIDGTGTPDTFEWSEDAGVTWNSTDIPMTTDTMYLSYGITLTWAASTGHTDTDYWTIACDACQTSAVNQKISLSSIPVSGDAQVDQRKLYRTTANGASFFWLATISDNTATTFVDNIPDSALGSLMREDRDILTNGKFSAWWDDRLWVADVSSQIVYYSRIDYPEEFDNDVRFIKFREEGFDDEITQMVAYKDALYVFLRNSVYVIIRKPGGIYGRYLVTKDLGCIASWSMCEVNNTLMFLSYRGWEMYNGFESRPLAVSLALQRIFDSIDMSSTYLDKITSVHNRKYNEVLLSLPHRSGGAAAITVVYNYQRNKLYTFTYHLTPASFNECRDSSKNPVVEMGTTGGYLFECDSGYQDGATNITATIRKPWIESRKYADIRRVVTEYEIPNDMTLTLNAYVNFDKDVQRTDSLTGVSINATDIEMRRPISDKTELGLRGEYFCIEYTNAENLGGDLYINKASVYYAPKTVKDKVYPD